MKLYKPKRLGSKDPKRREEIKIRMGPEPVLLVGHAIDVLRSLPKDSVHCLVQSPPYYLCRAYGLPPVTFGGADGCDHEWGPELPGARARWGDLGTLSDKQRSNRGSPDMVEALERGAGQYCQKCGTCKSHTWEPLELYSEHPQRNGDEGIGFDNTEVTRNQRWRKSDVCRPCGGWRGELGQEPTSELFIHHLVEIFGAARRVLHPSGLLFVNLGDTRANSGKGRNKDGQHGAKHGDKQRTNKGTTAGVMPKGISEGRQGLLGIPDRFKEAMVADGWIHVSAMVTPKGNPMVQSMRGNRWVNHYVKVEDSTIDGSGKQKDVGGTYAGFNERWKAQRYAQGNVPGENASRTYRGGSGGVGRGVAPEDIGGKPSKWMRCPGCTECNKNKGKVLRKGSGRPTDAYEMFHVFAKDPRYFYNTEAVRKYRLAESSVGRAKRYATAIEKYGSPERPDSKHRVDGVDQGHAYRGIASGGSPNAYNASGGNSLNWMRLDELVTPQLIRVRDDLSPGEQIQLFAALPEELLAYFTVSDPVDDPDVLFWHSEPLKEKHYAAYPSFLPAYALSAGCAPRVCSECLWPYAPVIEGDTHDEGGEDWEWRKVSGAVDGHYQGEALKDYQEHKAQTPGDVKSRIIEGMKKRTVVDWWKICDCDAPSALPTAGDIFAGSGTTLRVARKMGISSFGIELKPEYAAIARKRCALPAGVSESDDETVVDDLDLEAGA